MTSSYLGGVLVILPLSACHVAHASAVQSWVALCLESYDEALLAAVAHVLLPDAVVAAAAAAAWVRVYQDASQVVAHPAVDVQEGDQEGQEGHQEVVLHLTTATPAAEAAPAAAAVEGAVSGAAVGAVVEGAAAARTASNQSEASCPVAGEAVG